MTMTNEAVLRAFHNEIEETVPVSFWHHFAPSGFVDGLQDDHHTYDLNVHGHEAYYQALDLDFVKTMLDGYYVDPVLLPDQPKTWTMLREVQPIQADDRWISEQLSLAKAQVQAAQGKLTFYTVFSPLTMFKWSLMDHATAPTDAGDHCLADLYEADSTALKRLLAQIGEDLAKLIRQLPPTGITGIYYSTQSIQDDRVKTADFFHAVIEPVDLAVIEAINDAFALNILHVCGLHGATNDLRLYKDYPLQVVNWATHVDGYSLAEGKKLFGDKPVLGGFGDGTQDILYAGTKAEIQAETRRLIQEAGRTGVIIGADCTVPRDTPLDHIRWVQEAARNFSKQ